MSLNKDQADYYEKVNHNPFLMQYYQDIDPKTHNFYYQNQPNPFQLNEQLNQSPIRHQAIIRFFHASPSVSNVDININEFRFLTNVPYKDVSHSLALPNGKYQIDIYPTGNQVSTLISKKIIVQPRNLFTFVLTGDTEKLNLLSVESHPSVPIGESKIRLIHLIKNGPIIDFAATYGDVVFPKVQYKQVTNYLGITPMTVDLEARITGTKEIFLPMKKMRFKPNRAYTIALIGSSLEEYPIEAIILKETYPKIT